MAIIVKPAPLVTRLVYAEPVDTVIVREKIVNVISRRLSRIRVTNGYSCDCGLTVNEGKIVTISPEVPSLNFWDGDESATKDHGNEINTMRVTVELYEKGEPQDSSTAISRRARRMVADVRSALLMNDGNTRPDPTLDGTAEGLTYSSSDLVLGYNTESWLGVIVDFEVTYHTLFGNLYRSK